MMNIRLNMIPESIPHKYFCFKNYFILYQLVFIFYKWTAVFLFTLQYVHIWNFSVEENLHHPRHSWYMVVCMHIPTLGTVFA